MNHAARQYYKQFRASAICQDQEFHHVLVRGNFETKDLLRACGRGYVIKTESSMGFLELIFLGS